ncbi:hypothetical protein Daus18300_000513 [Diaporthe australafricana]|uniref:Major facilitator superfamily transporter n=1 Tax=Diaporthe australafricana TaxID=127596 RepID=A0ABR3Y4K2_9PEZI
MGRNSRTYEKLSSDSAELLLSQDERDFGGVRKVTLSRGFSIITKSPKMVVALAIPLITMLATIVFGGVLLSRTWKPTLSQITISTRIPPDYCGNSPAEAKAAGCKFEANNFAWLHPLCYNEELEENWRHGPWASDLEFWETHSEDWHGVGRIEPEEAFKGEIDTVWVNTLQHRRHCLHIWKKYVVFANRRLPLDSWTAESEHHVDHCVMLLRDFNNTWPDERVSSKLTLKYPSCEFGPVAIHITPMPWTSEQIRLHHP